MRYVDQRVHTLVLVLNTKLRDRDHGYGASGLLNDLHELRLAEPLQWRPLDSSRGVTGMPPAPRMSLGMAAAEERLYVYGGDGVKTTGLVCVVKELHQCICVSLPFPLDFLPFHFEQLYLFPFSSFFLWTLSCLLSHAP